jgi:hypothetical protein
MPNCEMNWPIRLDKVIGYNNVDHKDAWASAVYLRDCFIRIFWNRVPHFGSPKRVLVQLQLRFRPSKCALQNALKSGSRSKRSHGRRRQSAIHPLPPPVPPNTSTLPPQQIIYTLPRRRCGLRVLSPHAAASPPRSMPV